MFYVSTDFGNKMFSFFGRNFFTDTVMLTNLTLFRETYRKSQKASLQVNLIR